MLAERIRKNIAYDLFSEKIYWLNQLSGELPETALIADYIRPDLHSKKNKSVQFELGSHCSQSIIEFSNGAYGAVYVFLLTAVNVLLEKYTGNRDLMVGIPIYQGNQVENIGNQVLPLRTHLTKALTFQDLLIQTKDNTISAYVHQNYPVDRLSPLLGLAQHQNRCSIFDVVVLLENIHAYDQVSHLNHDLTISFAVTGDDISGKIDYSDALFRDGTINAIAKCYTNLVECVIEKPDIKLSDIVFLKAQDQKQLLEDFNPNHGIYSIEQTISRLFEKQVEQTPNHVAAIWKDTQVTYQALNLQANQLARRLQGLGLKAGEFVGILKDRDINFLIAILAIHKAGGAYVPIDSTYPLDRIQYMLSNSEVRFLLIDHCSLEILNNCAERCSELRHVISLDVDSDGLDKIELEQISLSFPGNFNGLSQANLSAVTHAINPAYMLYTSGSTGLPKGAIIRHDGAVNHIYAQLEALALNEGFNFLQSAPASSDISVWQFLGPLLTGGKTVIVDPETVCNPEQLFEVIKVERLTLVELVPVVLKGLIDHVCQLSLEDRALPDLKLMMVTGEYVSVDLVNQWLGVYPKIQIANAYGPTEAADDITQFITDKPLPTNQRTVPIGTPLANLKLYVLDAQMQLVPIGAPGEICVSGIGVGNGYWKNEEKTHLSFVPNPFPNFQPGPPAHYPDLIYKTGDLGRWLPDGNLEFLGRIDHQVKIRGFRIELGEIEARLVQHPSVQEAVVVIREDNPGHQTLVAYIVESLAHGAVAANEHSQAASTRPELMPQLRHFLKEKLPEPMVPSAFVQLDKLPLAPSGKVDRRALPAPPQTRPGLERSYVAPTTPLETAIAEIWQQILGLDQVGIYDNFFELGGHSLLITQLFTRLQNTFDVKLALRKLFDLPTIANIAQEIQRLQQGLGGDEEPVDFNFAAEAILDPNIQPSGIPYNPDIAPAAIFLTGATGFLGACLLYELLQQTKADIYCLVRASSIAAGQQKIQRKLASYLLWDAAFSSRVIPVIGDLSQPLLGLAQQQFQGLASQLDRIYHSGALVNSISPYSTFKAANVLGTQEVLRLACREKVKPVHFVSSTGVVPSGQAAAGTIQEQDNLDNAAMPGSGYARSKRVAEKLVTIARDRGLPVCIYRPGFVTGHSQTGVCNTGDMIYRMIKGCIQLESMPDLDISLDLNPCDYVSQAVVYLSRQTASLGQVFHLVNPQPLSMGQVCQYVNSLGYPVALVDYGEWREKLVNEGNTPENALSPLIPIFAAPDPQSMRLEAGGASAEKTPMNPQPIRQVVQPFDIQNTLTGLANSPIACPALDDKLLGHYFTYLVQSGFLKAPQIHKLPC
ncbi:MAG: amino acid adenylation domain-containing protein [Cyanobacteria bacterium J06635_15]